MYEYDDENESESNSFIMSPTPPQSSYQLKQQKTAHSQPSNINLMRSKSYDIKLNNVENDEHAFVKNNLDKNSSSNNNGNEHTKIIVTSFAPEPKAKSTMRPGSFHFSKEEDSTSGKVQQKAESYENNL